MRRLEGGFQGYRGGAMQDLGYDLLRISIPRISVNKPKLCPATCLQLYYAPKITHLRDASEPPLLPTFLLAAMLT
jgi:hypothetical protein